MTREELIKTLNMVKYPIYNNGYEQYKLDNIKAMEQNIENVKFDQMISKSKKLDLTEINQCIEEIGEVLKNVNDDDEVEPQKVDWSQIPF